jgi:ribosomal protein L37AE/L43A
MMGAMRDFTKFAMGEKEKVDGELIVVCPYCARYAVKRENVGIRFVHSIGTVETNGCIELVDDSCPARPVLSHNPPRTQD